jgi:hypothetical protein
MTHERNEANRQRAVAHAALDAVAALLFVPLQHLGYERAKEVLCEHVEELYQQRTAARNEEFTIATAEMRAERAEQERDALRAEVATLTQERDEARADTASISADVDELRSQASRSVVVLVPIRNVFAAIRATKNNGAIELPGGKVDEGESTLAAARREASEELGVPVSVNPCALGEFLHVFRGRLWRCEAFLGEAVG